MVRARFDDHGRILDSNLPCLQCGYSLRGLLPAGDCPECGTPVERSVHGNLLRHCNPKWIGKLVWGMRFMVAAFIASPVLGSWGLAMLWLEGSPSIVGLLPAALLVIGQWQLTSPDAGTQDMQPAFDVRRLARVAMVVGFAFSVARLSAQLASNDIMAIGLGMIGVLATVVATLAICIYARQLALRALRLRLAHSTRWAMWVLAACDAILGVAGLFASSLGPWLDQSDSVVLAVAGGGFGLLIFFLVALMLCIQYLEAFNKAARQARLTWGID